jgi:elongation factor P--(R)-beta-lysine ligase
VFDRLTAESDARDLPTASIATLQKRAKLLQRLRCFFSEHGYWECETPVLSYEVVVDANLEPFQTTDHAGRTLYLQTSPEAGMKRLLAAGAEAIFQVSRVMRRGEVGTRHNPEFTMIEWYRVGDSHIEQMEFTEELVRKIYSAAGCELLAPAFERLGYDDAFERFAGSRVLQLSNREIVELAGRHDVEAPASLSLDDRDGWLNILLAELVEPHLGADAPVFLIDYPASQSALARTRGEVFPVAERFELYDGGVELCNGYHELTDPEELARRTEKELANRGEAARLQGPGLLQLAMRRGLPECSGVALGFDRLVMRALGLSVISDVIAFPIDRA